MTDVVRDFIAAETAKLERVLLRKIVVEGYGVDLRCTTDVLPRLDEVDPFSTLAIGEALFRMCACAREGLPDDPSYGIDVVGMLHRPTTPEELAGMAGEIHAQWVTDDRVDSVSVEVTAPSPGELQISGRVTPVDSSETFALVIVVQEGAAMLEALS